MQMCYDLGLIRHHFFGSTEARSWAAASFTLFCTVVAVVHFASLPPSWHHCFTTGPQLDFWLCGPGASLLLPPLFLGHEATAAAKCVV